MPDPSTIATAAISKLASRPRARASAGAPIPAKAKATGGNIPSTPSPRLESGISFSMTPRMGEIAATAVRTFRAMNRMPRSARMRPLQRVPALVVIRMILLLERRFCGHAQDSSHVLFIAAHLVDQRINRRELHHSCLLYTSDAADEED